MSKFKCSLLGFVFLVTLCYGEPSQVASSQPDNCSWWKYVRDDMRCTPETFSIKFKAIVISDTDIDEQEKNRALQKACIPALECIANLECLSTYNQKMRAACNSATYLSSASYTTCKRKIDETTHDCKKGGECDIFGVHNCDKNLIINVCGHAEWVKYRDTLLKMKRLEENFAEKFEHFGSL